MAENGVFLVWTLEDAIREIPGAAVHTWKVAGRTAIPAGRYRVQTTWSPRFKRPLPLVLDVPGFAGVRIGHAGNDHEDTDGCILCGLHRGPGVIGSSVAGGSLVCGRIADAEARGEDVWITIRNPESLRKA